MADLKLTKREVNVSGEVAMKNIIIIFIILMFSAIGYAQIDTEINSSNKSSEKDNEETVMARVAGLIDKGSYHYSKDAIPQEVMAKLYELGLKEPIFANPDEKFLAGDVIKEEEEGLPSRKLIVVIKDEQGNCIIAYYHGGFGFHEHLLFFEIKDGKISNFWTGEATGQRRKGRGMVQLLQEKKFWLKPYRGKIPATCQY